MFLSSTDRILPTLSAGAGVRRDAVGAALTTFRIGGPIDLFADVKTPDDVRIALRWAREEGLPVAWLGGGSNSLVADTGVRGLVLRYRNHEITRTEKGTVRAAAGITFNGFVRWCIGHGLAGYESWAGTPGTVGGAVHGNAHFQGRPFSERVERVGLLNRDGIETIVRGDAMNFGYDRSRLQTSGELAVWVEVRVAEDDPEVLRRRAKDSLAFRKRTQPLALPSAGCVFQNPEDQRARLPESVPCSAGALVDRVGLKGEARGGARISPVHANFIVNEGSASAANVMALMNEARRRVLDSFGVTLRDEIVRLGDFS